MPHCISWVTNTSVLVLHNSSVNSHDQFLMINNPITIKFVPTDIECPIVLMQDIIYFCKSMQKKIEDGILFHEENLFEELFSHSDLNLTMNEMHGSMVLLPSTRMTIWDDSLRLLNSGAYINEL
jgi:hypothetical protein